ncbi:MAG TPA: purine-nucleoside phosphorylase [Sphingomonadales bacterium]|nr:purine-nucleoside phosphorylase [Sphingomonadales bacterium]
MKTKGKPSPEFTRAERAAKFVLSKTKLRPRIGLVLGSGLGAFADDFDQSTRIPYKKIPHFPQSTAIGHAGNLVIGKVGGIPVAGMQGRVHFYEGYPMQEVAFPMRVFGRMGLRAVILTNAAGGINRNYSQGALVVIRDHINLMGMNPLAGPNDERFGPRFFDMTTAYWKPYREIALREARRLGVNLHEGVYCAISGPSYETPAEIQLMERSGADLAGMSTVPEVIAARHLGVKVLGISCVTNMAAGVTGQPLNHEEVLETGRRVQGQLVALLRAVIPHLAANVKKED